MALINGPEDLPAVPDILEVTGGEFCASQRMDSSMVAATCRHGYIPMGLELSAASLLLVKCHFQRCVLDPQDLHVPSNVQRYSRGLTIHCNGDFSGTLRAIVETHRDNWLVPELVSSLTDLHINPKEGVRTHSVEVHDHDRLVAGEVGYSTGKVYTSLSGFHRRNGAGTVQLVALAVILRETGFDFWDLGMEAEYKLRLGARLVDRNAFLHRYRQSGAEQAEEDGPGLPGGTRSCIDLVRRARASIRP
jgi:Leu/Phe-tRNA-protein transferase